MELLTKQHVLVAIKLFSDDLSVNIQNPRLPLLAGVSAHRKTLVTARVATSWSHDQEQR